jgi:hypothetical protein
MSWDRLYERLAWIAQCGEPARCRHLLSVLALHAADRDGSCRVSIGTLATETGLGTTSVRLTIGDMLARGVIVVPEGRKGGGARAGTRYVVPAFAGAGLRTEQRGSGFLSDDDPSGGDSRHDQHRGGIPRRTAGEPSARPPGGVPDADSRRVARAPSTPVRERATDAPERIDLDDRLLAVAQEVGLSAAQARRELDACLDWHRANGRRRVDWQATARNWLRRANQLSSTPVVTLPVSNGMLPRTGDLGAWRALASRHGLSARPGEDWVAFQARIRRCVEHLDLH